jgi:hypothetical protein
VGVARPFACVVVAWPSKLRFKTKKNNSADFFGWDCFTFVCLGICGFGQQTTPK